MENEIVENVIYWYTNKEGIKCYTPNCQFAHKQAELYGTHDVFIIQKKID